MPRESYGKQIEDSNVMLAGIKSHKDKLEARGINDQYIEKFAALNKNCVDTNSEQEKGKADLKNLEYNSAPGEINLRKTKKITRKMGVKMICH